MYAPWRMTFQMIATCQAYSWETTAHETVQMRHVDQEKQCSSSNLINKNRSFKKVLQTTRYVVLQLAERKTWRRSELFIRILSGGVNTFLLFIFKRFSILQQLQGVLAMLQQKQKQRIRRDKHKLSHRIIIIHNSETIFLLERLLVFCLSTIFNGSIFRTTQRA